MVLGAAQTIYDVLSASRNYKPHYFAAPDRYDVSVINIRRWGKKSSPRDPRFVAIVVWGCALATRFGSNI
jgi:hypothetical protein